MPLSPEAKVTNLEKSLVAWCQATLVTQAGLVVFYDEAPDTARPDAWVHVDFLHGLRREFGRHIDQTRLGSQVHMLVQLSLCRKRASLTNIYSMAALSDAASAPFKAPQDIPIRDYDMVGTPVIGLVSVEEGATEIDADDGRSSGVIVRILSIPITYVEAYTLV